jgi:hypothetical protein
MKHGGRRKGAGRKKGSTNKLGAELKERAQALALPALKRMGEIAVRGESESVQVRATDLLLNRGFGRPAQADSDEQATINPPRVYRWARNEDEAIMDPARQRASKPESETAQAEKPPAEKPKAGKRRA